MVSTRPEFETSISTVVSWTTSTTTEVVPYVSTMTVTSTYHDIVQVVETDTTVSQKLLLVFFCTNEKLLCIKLVNTCPYVKENTCVVILYTYQEYKHLYNKKKKHLCPPEHMSVWIIIFTTPGLIAFYSLTVDYFSSTRWLKCGIPCGRQPSKPCCCKRHLLNRKPLQ